jgi:hypothetical protein
LPNWRLDGRYCFKGLLLIGGMSNWFEELGRDLREYEQRVDKIA